MRLPEDRGLFYDIDAMGFNAKHCRSQASRFGFRFRSVLKGGYFSPQLTAGLVKTGVQGFCVGIHPPNHLFRDQNLDIATLYPGSGAGWSTKQRLARVTEVEADVLQYSHNCKEPICVLLPISTTERREGLPLGRILGAMMRLRSRFGSRIRLQGFQLNYGCVKAQKADYDVLNRLLNALAGEQFLALLDSNPIISLGGSALLPDLRQIQIPLSFEGELRAGEAVLAGTIPGHEEVSNLRRPAVYRARVLQRLETRRSDRSRLLVDVGSDILDHRRCAHDDLFKFESISSEVSVLTVQIDEPSSEVHGIELVLNYHEIERALDRCRGRFCTKIETVRAA